MLDAKRLSVRRTVMNAAISYIRTSSQANVGADKDSATRQRAAINEYAARADITIVQEFYDAAVSGADHIHTRGGFAALLQWAQDNKVSTVLVENASRFSRDLIVQETGVQLLKARGISLIATDDPDAFTADTPTARMVRQILGSVSEFEKANLVAKLKGARDRKSEKLGHRIEGRKGYNETAPELVRVAKRLHRASPKTGKRRTLEQIAEELASLGYKTINGKQFGAEQVKRLISN